MFLYFLLQVTTSIPLATESSGKTASNKAETSKTEVIVIAVTANAVLIAIIAVLVLVLCRMRKRYLLIFFMR